MEKGTKLGRGFTLWFTEPECSFWQTSLASSSGAGWTLAAGTAAHSRMRRYARVRGLSRLY